MQEEWDMTVAKEKARIEQKQKMEEHADSKPDESVTVPAPVPENTNSIQG